MNKERAKEIAASPIMASVTYNGSPIYIQHVDDDTNMASIYPLGEPHNERHVPVNDLKEE